MGGRRRGLGAVLALTGDGRSASAVQYRRVREAIAAQHRIRARETFLMLEVARCARLYLAFVAAADRLEAARAARADGKGRRPSAALIDRLAHRQQAANNAYQAAIDHLAEEVKRRPGRFNIWEQQQEDEAEEQARQARLAKARERRQRRKERGAPHESQSVVPEA